MDPNHVAAPSFAIITTLDEVVAEAAGLLDLLQAFTTRELECDRQDSVNHCIAAGIAAAVSRLQRRLHEAFAATHAGWVFQDKALSCARRALSDAQRELAGIPPDAPR